MCLQEHATDRRTLLFRFGGLTGGAAERLLRTSETQGKTQKEPVLAARTSIRLRQINAYSCKRQTAFKAGLISRAGPVRLESARRVYSGRNGRAISIDQVKIAARSP
jgi:hypothetical protein